MESDGPPAISTHEEAEMSVDKSAAYAIAGDEANNGNEHYEANGTNGSGYNQDAPLEEESVEQREQSVSGEEFFQDSRVEDGSDEQPADEGSMDVDQNPENSQDTFEESDHPAEPEVPEQQEQVEPQESTEENTQPEDSEEVANNKESEPVDEDITDANTDQADAQVEQKDDEGNQQTEEEEEGAAQESFENSADSNPETAQTVNDETKPESDETVEDETKPETADEAGTDETKPEAEDEAATDETKLESDVTENEEAKPETEEVKEGGDQTTETTPDDGGNADVVTVEDDGKELSPAAEDKTIPDEEYYKTISAEELEWYKEHAPDLDKNLHCTACFKQVTNDFGSSQGIVRHPHLGVGVCKQCKIYYKDGEWQRDEEGFDVYCRWCAEGGDLIICDKCPNAFCKRCLQRNLGRKFVSEITSAEEWKCLICDPKPLWEMRALYYGIYTHQQEILAKKAARKKASGSSETAGTSSPVPEKVVEDIFTGNLSEALAVLEETRKSLDGVAQSWSEANKIMDPEIATQLTREMRKIYAISKQSMDQLDKAIVTSFVESYPTLSKRIHMGKINAAGAVEDEDEAAPTPRKRRSPQKKKPVKKATPAKKKVVKKPPPPPAKKKKPAPAKKSQPVKKSLKVPPKKKKTIVVNGRPVTAEYVVTPSLMGGSGKKRPAPASIKRKRAPQYSDDSDSDIEIIGTSAPPPLKKRKPGPKSRY